MSAESQDTATYDEAVAMLPDGDKIHTFRNPGIGMLIGADHARTGLLDRLRAASVIHRTGGVAASMHHGLAIEDGHGFLFIETRP